MREPEMDQVARLIRLAAVDGRPSDQVAGLVEELLRPFQRLRFSFDP
jgi:hypothetical protein